MILRLLCGYRYLWFIVSGVYTVHPHISLLHLSSDDTQVCLNTFVYVPLWACLRVWGSNIPKSGISGSQGIAYLNWWKRVRWLLERSTSLYSTTTISLFPTFLPILGKWYMTCLIFASLMIKWYYVLICFTQNASKVEHLFTHLLAFLISLLWFSSLSIAYFSIGCLVSFLVNLWEFSVHWR